jgi:hypothetical protein
MVKVGPPEARAHYILEWREHMQELSRGTGTVENYHRRRATRTEAERGMGDSLSCQTDMKLSTNSKLLLSYLFLYWGALGITLLMFWFHQPLTGHPIKCMCTIWSTSKLPCLMCWIVVLTDCFVVMLSVHAPGGCAFFAGMGFVVVSLVIYQSVLPNQCFWDSKKNNASENYIWHDEINPPISGNNFGNYKNKSGILLIISFCPSFWDIFLAMVICFSYQGNILFSGLGNCPCVAKGYTYIYLNGSTSIMSNIYL